LDLDNVRGPSADYNQKRTLRPGKRQANAELCIPVCPGRLLRVWVQASVRAPRIPRRTTRDVPSAAGWHVHLQQIRIRALPQSRDDARLRGPAAHAHSRMRPHGVLVPGTHMGRRAHALPPVRPILQCAGPAGSRLELEQRLSAGLDPAGINIQICARRHPKKVIRGLCIGGTTHDLRREPCSDVGTECGSGEVLTARPHALANARANCVR